MPASPVNQETSTTFSPAVLEGGGSVAQSAVAEFKASPIDSVSSTLSAVKVEESRHKGEPER
jgi:hypothetical protein